MEKKQASIRERLRYEFELGHSAAAATENICDALGPKAVSNATACRWHKRFQEGDFSRL